MTLKQRLTQKTVLHLFDESYGRAYSHCPCCGTFFRTRAVKRGQSLPGNQRTVGHDFPTARGGDPHHWVYICHRCNTEQGWLDYRSWARMLRLRDDRRAAAVDDLATFFAGVRGELT